MPRIFRTISVLIVLGFWLRSDMTCIAQVFDEQYYDDQSSVSLEAELGLFSNYVFRGQDLYNGTSVQPRIKPSLNTDIGSFYGEFFGQIAAEGDTKNPHGGTFQTTDPDGEIVRAATVTPAFDETDFDIGYAADLDLATLSFGHRWYVYSVHDDAPQYGRSLVRLENTAELHGTLDFDVVLHPYLRVAYDYDTNEGTYYETGLRQPFSMGLGNEKNSIIPFVKLGFVQDYNDGSHPIYKDNGLAFVDFGFRGVVYLAHGLSLQPVLNWNEGVDDYTNSNFTFGLSLVGDFSF
jgi:hypothetical protein